MSNIPDWLTRARSQWRFRGQERPEFAKTPGAGQESVWDYPRPPRIETDAREIVVTAEDAVVARTRDAVRVMETASPPTFYLPRDNVDIHLLAPGASSSFCEWKGAAQYWHIALPGRRIANAAWSYEDPLPGYESIQGWLAFYPARVACFVDNVRVQPQPGQLYGGWVTPELVGPFKGEPGTEWW